MRKPHKKSFCVPSAIITIAVCLVAMSLTTYAYFSRNITSSSNCIQTADYELEVTIFENNSEAAYDQVEKIDNKTFRATLFPDKKYDVMLKSGGTASTGFCVISAEGYEGLSYHTQQIGTDVNTEAGITNKITFHLSVTNPTIVTFYAHWGTSSLYTEYKETGVNSDLYIINGDEIAIEITGSLLDLLPTTTPAPEASASPTPETTATPTVEPMVTPSAEPAATPSTEPTAAPTAGPTVAPSEEPTEAPATEPTATPSTNITAAPTMAPSTEQPTTAPAEMPTAEPVGTPSIVPENTTPVQSVAPSTETTVTTPESAAAIAENQDITN